MNPAHNNPLPSTACIVRYLGPTNTLGSRVKLWFPRYKKAIVIPYDYTLSHCDLMAIAHLRTLGVECEYIAYLSKDENVLTIGRLYNTQLLQALGL
jgi:hypothetical protein